MRPSERSPRVMIVDDDQVSVMAMQRMIRKIDSSIVLEVAHDGEEALKKIRKEVAELGHLPAIIVTLDLNMPRMSGLEFLKAVREDPDLSKLVVFVFTTSDAMSDVQASYALNPAGYVVKETGTERFPNALRMLINYAMAAKLPT